MRPAPNSEGKTFKFELTAVCKRSIKRPKQTDRKIVWKQEELFRLSSDQFRSVFEFLKDYSMCLKRSSSFQELHNGMTHVLNVPALDVGSVGKFRLRGRDFRVQFR